VFVWFGNIQLPAWSQRLIPVVELGVAVTVIVTAFFGGQLVYDLGVNVAHL
jgi:uncharacterized membrane protein